MNALRGARTMILRFLRRRADRPAAMPGAAAEPTDMFERLVRGEISSREYVDHLDRRVRENERNATAVQRRRAWRRAR